MCRRMSALLAVALLLSGCHSTPEPDPLTSILPSPSAAATPTPAPPSTPSPTLPSTPGPTEEVKELWGFPIDDTHDAFEVDTKGELGTVLVTVERGEKADGEFGGYHYTLSVWEKSDLTTPIQQLEEIGPEFGGADLVDANFDGYTDFLCLWNWMAVNWPFNLYVWEETQGRFVHKADFLGRGVHVDEAEQVIEVYVHWTNADGEREVYHWGNGELACFRREEYSGDDHVTYELVDGVWQETFREPNPMMG